LCFVESDMDGYIHGYVHRYSDGYPRKNLWIWMWIWMGNFISTASLLTMSIYCTTFLVLRAPDNCRYVLFEIYRGANKLYSWYNFTNDTRIDDNNNNQEINVTFSWRHIIYTFR